MSESISTCFPTDILVQYDYTELTAHRTIIEPLADGTSQRRGLYSASGLLSASFTVAYLGQADRERVDTFLKARRGQLEPWYFFLPDADRIYKKYAVGTGTGASQNIIIPFIQSAVSQAYDNASLISSSLTPTIGTFGEDQLTVTATTGHTVSIDVTGRRRVGVRSTSDTLEWRVIGDTFPLMWQLTIPVVEV